MEDQKEKFLEIVNIIPIHKPLVAAFKGENGIIVRQVFAFEVIRFTDGFMDKYGIIFNEDMLTAAEFEDDFLGYANDAEEAIETYRNAEKKPKSSRKNGKSNVRKLRPK